MPNPGLECAVDHQNHEGKRRVLGAGKIEPAAKQIG
jgi:hypothetical protein